MDVDILLKALENEKNSKLINLTSTKIKEMKLDILKELHLPNNILIEYMTKLKEYIYVDELDDLNYGSFIRWVPINDMENIHLTTGANLCEIKVTDKGIQLILKSYSKRTFQIKMDECLIFQKLNNQELVLLKALDHLSK